MNENNKNTKKTTKKHSICKSFAMSFPSQMLPCQAENNLMH